VKLPKIGKFGVAVIAFTFGLGLSFFGPRVFLWVIQGKPAESVTAFENGHFKVLVRSQEFHHSGTVNTDICVAEVASREFPRDEIQCFMHGYDFYRLSVKWQSQQEIDVTFDGGRVSGFNNYAIVSPKDSLPIEFHIVMHDRRPYPQYAEQ
jgi:hypothetical protein